MREVAFVGGGRGIREALGSLAGGDAAVAMGDEDDFLASRDGFGDVVADGGDVLVRVGEMFGWADGRKFDEFGFNVGRLEASGNGSEDLGAVPGARDEEGGCS